MKIDNTEVFNFKGALRGMRNPLESHHKADSYNYVRFMHPLMLYAYKKYDSTDILKPRFIIGENDLKLAQKLILAGDEHSKFMRQILLSVDITAPLYWYKEFDTYKIGTVANSTSTMHKLSSTPITLECFEIGDYQSDIRLNGIYDDCNYSLGETFIPELINWLEQLRLKYLETKEVRYWKELIRWLPESWLQTRTVTMNYSNLRNMYFQRRNHKLTEWSVDFINWIEKLPYAKELIMLEV